MELGEATRLAGTFITRAIFKLHSLPLYDHGQRAARWWQRQESRLPLRAALAETREHLAHFAVRTEIDRAMGRSLHLTISALTLDPTPGRCPALNGMHCGVYADRPLTCRTVPLHYSRPASSLSGYLDTFVQTASYACKTTPDSPLVLEGDRVVHPEISEARAEAVALAKADRPWGEAIVRLMERPDEASAIGLPSYREVRENSDAGAASLVSMLAPWRIAKRLGLLSEADFTTTCRAQAALIRAELDRCTDPALFASLQPLLVDYDRDAPSLSVLQPKARFSLRLSSSIDTRS